MMLFVVTLVLIAPFIAMFGGRSYLINSLPVILGYFDELLAVGYISKEEREELERDMMN